MENQQKKTNRDNHPEKSTKLNKLIGYLKTLEGNGFTGYVRVNFSQGNIGRVEKFEEILKQ